MALADPIGAGAPKPDKLRALGIVALNGMFDEMDAGGVLRQAVDLLPSDLAIVSSFGADSAVILHMISEIDKANLPVLFLETGKHFPETLAYVETLTRRFGLTNVQPLRPDQADLDRFDPDPEPCGRPIRIRAAISARPNRSTVAVAGFGGWVTGRKRYQTVERGVLPHFELTRDDRIKINPLAYWTGEDVAAYRKAHDLPEHPLYDKGYRSIGCAPCTSVVAEGEDARSGRWRGRNKAECGIHFDVNARIAKPEAARVANLFKNGSFIADPWRDWEEGDAADGVAYTHVPLRGLCRTPRDLLEEPAPARAQARTGRCGRNDCRRSRPFRLDRHCLSGLYRRARLFDGAARHRAVRVCRRGAGGGRCADRPDSAYAPLRHFNAFVVTHAPTRAALAESGITGQPVHLQPVGLSEVPAGTRPFLRKSINIGPPA